MSKYVASVALFALPLCANAQGLSQILSDHRDFTVLPSYFFNDGNDRLCTRPKVNFSKDVMSVWDVSLYDVDFALTKTMSFPNGMLPFVYTDSENDKRTIGVTQNLFDGDDSYEYIEPIISQKNPYGVWYASGIRIVKDDGTILASISFGDEWNLSVSSDSFADGESCIQVLSAFDDRNLKSRYYLAVNIWKDSDDPIYSSAGEMSITRIYVFERGQVSSIKQVKDVKNRIKAFPVIPQKNEVVKVDLSAMQSPSSLSVVSANGKVVYNKVLSGEEKEVSVKTNGLSAGMYIVRVTDLQNVHDNCRIIIR